MTSLLIVTEGGSRVGLGHLRRCLTLAGALQQIGVLPTFRIAGGAAAENFVRNAGFAVEPLRDPADATELARIVAADPAVGVLIDSYAAAEDVFLACAAKKTIVLDDLLDRKLPVDLLINSAVGAERLDYSRLTEASLLLGPQYALLRPEFAIAPERTTRPRIERVLITMGGSDHGTLVCDVVRWCLAAAPDTDMAVVSGPFFENVEELRALTRGGRAVVLERPEMRDVMLLGDIAITSGGQTLFELAATALPAIVIATAGNQVQNVSDFTAAGTIRNAGRHSDPQLRSRFDAAYDELRDESVRSAMSSRGPELVDGRGAERTAARILELLQGRRSVSG